MGDAPLPVSDETKLGEKKKKSRKTVRCKIKCIQNFGKRLRKCEYFLENAAAYRNNLY
jgi:hypothetical protein